MTHTVSKPPTARGGLLPAELLFICPVAPFLLAPLLHPGLFGLRATQAAAAVTASAVPFLSIAAAVYCVYHFWMPRWLLFFRHTLPRLALHGLVTITTTLLVSSVLWLLGVRGCEGSSFVSWSWICLAISFLLVVPGLIVESLRQRRTQAEQRAQVEHQERLTAQLQALQARTNPHFLFNSLNTVASLIFDNPQQAEQTILQLAEILRYGLNSGRVLRVPLSSEVHIARAYLAVQAARFGARLQHQLYIDPGLHTALVPPLLLQPLLENALLHGLSHRREGGRVQLHVERCSNRLQIKVLDDGPGAGGSLHHGSGTYLQDVALRLALLYGDKGGIQTGAGPAGGVLVSITLPVEHA